MTSSSQEQILEALQAKIGTQRITPTNPIDTNPTASPSQQHDDGNDDNGNDDNGDDLWLFYDSDSDPNSETRNSKDDPAGPGWERLFSLHGINRKQIHDGIIHTFPKMLYLPHPNEEPSNDVRMKFVDKMRKQFSIRARRTAYATRMKVDTTVLWFCLRCQHRGQRKLYNDNGVLYYGDFLAQYKRIRVLAIAGTGNNKDSENDRFNLCLTVVQFVSGANTGDKGNYTFCCCSRKPANMKRLDGTIRYAASLSYSDWTMLKKDDSSIPGIHEHGLFTRAKANKGRVFTMATPTAAPALQRMEVTWIVFTKKGTCLPVHLGIWTRDDGRRSYTGHGNMAQVQATTLQITSPNASARACASSTIIANKEMCYALAFCFTIQILFWRQGKSDNPISDVASTNSIQDITGTTECPPILAYHKGQATLGKKPEGHVMLRKSRRAPNMHPNCNDKRNSSPSKPNSNNTNSATNKLTKRLLRAKLRITHAASFMCDTIKRYGTKRDTNLPMNDTQIIKYQAIYIYLQPHEREGRARAVYIDASLKANKYEGINI
eukprot:jgi/Psemu1/7493/gm1.7493_g